MSILAKDAPGLKTPRVMQGRHYGGEQAGP
jgi:hypothetical protein